MKPRTTSFDAGAGTTTKRPPPEALEAAANAARTEDPLMDGWLRQLIDNDVGLDDLSDADRAVIESMEDGSGTLHFTFENNQMSGIRAEEEVARLADDGVISVQNASPALMEYLIKSNKFSDVIMSAHGSPEGIYITDPDGSPRLLPAEDIASMMEGTAVNEALIAACNTGSSVSDALTNVGVDNVTFDNTVTNGQASDAVEAFAEDGSLSAVDMDIEKYRENVEILRAGDPSDVKFAGMVYDASGQSKFTEGDATGPAPATRRGGNTPS